MLLKLWTVRPLDDYLLLKKQGFYTADAAYVLPERIEAYRWMSQKLAERTLPPQGVEMPLWAWYCAHGSRQPKPDLRKTGHLEKGAQGVRIEFAMPAEQVLLSSFDGWHSVLNNHFFSLDDAEYAYHETLKTKLPSAEYQREKERSWQRIFDLDLIPDRSVYEIQAVFWQLELSSVIKVDFFTAR